MSEAASQESEILALFKKAAWEIDQKELPTLKSSDRITELGLDSVAMLEVIGFLEDELDIHFPDDELNKVQTLGDLSKMVAGLTK